MAIYGRLDITFPSDALALTHVLRRTCEMHVPIVANIGHVMVGNVIVSKTINFFHMRSGASYREALFTISLFSIFRASNQECFTTFALFSVTMFIVKGLRALPAY